MGFHLMNHSDIAALMKGAAPVIRDYVAGAVQPLLLQIEAMRKEIDTLKSVPAPKDGKDADVDEIAALAAAALLPDIMEVRGMVEALPAPVELPDVPAMISEALAESEGRVLMQCNAMVDKRVELEVHSDFGAEIKQLRTDLDALTPRIEAIGGAIGEEIAEHVGKSLATIPVPLTADETKAMVADAVAALPPAGKGKDADPVEVAAQIAEEVQRAVAALPVPQDGKSVTAEELRPMVEEATAKAVAALPVAKDGIDAVDVMIDREGSLVFTMSDGRMKDVGQVVGRDGVDADMAAIAKAISEQVAAIPKPKDGADGVGFDDMTFTHDGERTFTFRFVKGDRVVEKSIDVPMMIYRGIYREGEQYKQGDTCTWGGHLWHCDTATTDKPDGAERCWSMAVRKGKDGKDGTLKEPPKPGPVKVG